MNQEQQVNAAIAAIRAINGLWSEDVAAITAALSCQIAKDANAHAKLHVAAIDALDNLTNYLNDQISERVAVAALEAKEESKLRSEESAVERFQFWMRGAAV